MLGKYALEFLQKTIVDIYRDYIYMNNCKEQYYK